MTTIADRRRGTAELPGKPRAIVTTVSGCVVERNKADPNCWIVHHNGARYLLTVLDADIKKRGYDTALFEAVELVKVGKRGTRL